MGSQKYPVKTLMFGQYICLFTENYLQCGTAPHPSCRWHCQDFPRSSLQAILEMMSGQEVATHQKEQRCDLLAEAERCDLLELNGDRSTLKDVFVLQVQQVLSHWQGCLFVVWFAHLM